MSETIMPKKRRSSAGSHSGAIPSNNVKDQQIKEILVKKTKRKQTVNQLKDLATYSCLIAVVIITFFTYPTQWETVSVHHVWYYGWITAISTGLGVLPFFIFSEPDKFWLAVSNAVAGGMMIAASYSLVSEAVRVDTEHFGILSQMSNIDVGFHTTIRAFLGVILGIGFILFTKKVLDKYEDEFDIFSLGDVLGQQNSQKMILIVFVMTLHSMTEGIGIGVSFGGQTGLKLGHLISMSLAVHNVPEGLAVGLVLTSRKVGKLNAVLWAIFTSLPQPIFAIPAFYFVERFAPLLPAGLGFASGAMFYVAIFELLTEAAEDSSILQTSLVSIVSCGMMLLMQEAVKFAS